MPTPTAPMHLHMAPLAAPEVLEHSSHAVGAEALTYDAARYCQRFSTTAFTPTALKDVHMTPLAARQRRSNTVRTPAVLKQTRMTPVAARQRCSNTVPTPTAPMHLHMAPLAAPEVLEHSSHAVGAEALTYDAARYCQRFSTTVFTPTALEHMYMTPLAARQRCLITVSTPTALKYSHKTPLTAARGARARCRRRRLGVEPRPPLKSLRGLASKSPSRYARADVSGSSLGRR